MTTWSLRSDDEAVRWEHRKLIVEGDLYSSLYIVSLESKDIYFRACLNLNISYFPRFLTYHLNSQQGQIHRGCSGMAVPSFWTGKHLENPWGIFLNSPNQVIIHPPFLPCSKACLLPLPTLNLPLLLCPLGAEEA